MQTTPPAACGPVVSACSAAGADRWLARLSQVPGAAVAMPWRDSLWPGPTLAVGQPAARVLELHRQHRVLYDLQCSIELQQLQQTQHQTRPGRTQGVPAHAIAQKPSCPLSSPTEGHERLGLGLDSPLAQPTPCAPPSARFARLYLPHSAPRCLISAESARAPTSQPQPAQQGPNHGHGCCHTLSPERKGLSYCQ